MDSSIVEFILNVLLGGGTLERMCHWGCAFGSCLSYFLLDVMQDLTLTTVRRKSLFGFTDCSDFSLRWTGSKEEDQVEENVEEQLMAW